MDLLSEYKDHHNISTHPKVRREGFCAYNKLSGSFFRFYGVGGTNMYDRIPTCMTRISHVRNWIREKNAKGYGVYYYREYEGGNLHMKEIK